MQPKAVEQVVQSRQCPIRSWGWVPWAWQVHQRLVGAVSDLQRLWSGQATGLCYPGLRPVAAGPVESSPRGLRFPGVFPLVWSGPAWLWRYLVLAVPVEPIHRRPVLAEPAFRPVWPDQVASSA